MNVLYVCPAEDNCKYWRVDIPSTALNEMTGGEHAARSVLLDEFATGQAKKDCAWADLVVIQRVLVDNVADACRKLREAGTDVVVDFDDALPILPRSSEDAYDYWFSPSPNGRRIDRLYCAIRDVASAVTVSTPGLAKMYGQYHANVRVMPNYPDARRYSSAPGRRPRRSPTGLVIGWTGSNHKESLIGSGVLRALRHILRDRRDVKIAVYGLGAGNVWPHDLGLPAARILWRPWTAFPVSNYPHYMRDFDLGLAVLADWYDEYRSGVKIMDYTLMSLAGHNLPWLASDCQPYQEFAEWGTLVQNTPDAWQRQICNALEHLDERRELMPQAASEMVERYDVSRHIGEIVDAYRDIAGK